MGTVRTDESREIGAPGITLRQNHGAGARLVDLSVAWWGTMVFSLDKVHRFRQERRYAAEGDP